MCVCVCVCMFKNSLIPILVFRVQYQGRDSLDVCLKVFRRVVAVRTTVNNVCMIVMTNVAEFIMRSMGIPVVRYVSFDS